jgi:hypothetical protein
MSIEYTKYIEERGGSSAKDFNKNSIAHRECLDESLMKMPIFHSRPTQADGGT